MTTRVIILVALLLLGAATAFSQCTPSATTLCFHGTRFSAEVSWQDAGGMSGVGQAVPMSPQVQDTGYYWFADRLYPEVFMSVLDACAAFGSYWVLSGSLTDFEYTLTVTDHQTGTSQVYFNPLGERSVVVDIVSFPVCSVPRRAGDDRTGGAAVGSPISKSVEVWETYSAPDGAPCVPDPTTLCLVGDRFQAQVDWVAPGGGPAPGQVVATTTSHSGGFGFFAPDSLTLMVKIVETCAHFEVHFAAWTNVEFTLTLTDTATGLTRTYFNPQGVLAPGTGDLTAFPGPCLIFEDGFEAGNTSAWSSTQP